MLEGIARASLDSQENSYEAVDDDAEKIMKHSINSGVLDSEEEDSWSDSTSSEVC